MKPHLLPIIALPIIALAGCTMTDFYPEAGRAMVDGREFIVTPHPSAPGVYGAGPDRPTGAEALTGAGLALPPQNIRAIEQTTGCTVEPNSATNTASGFTWAAVVC